MVRFGVRFRVSVSVVVMVRVSVSSFRDSFSVFLRAQHPNRSVP